MRPWLAPQPNYSRFLASTHFHPPSTVPKFLLVTAAALNNHVLVLFEDHVGALIKV